MAYFIEIASSIWNRKDIVSIVCIRDSEDIETKKKLKKLFSILGKSFFTNPAPSGGVLDPAGRWGIKIIEIDLSPIGKASHLKNSWDGEWFKEDYCQGPGNVLFIMPDGSVKPCCGYASDMEQLTIGNIKHDSIKEIIKNANKNRFVFTIFNSGLSTIRKRLRKNGFRFPGRTSNHCYFCWYVLKNVSRELLFRCLD